MLPFRLSICGLAELPDFSGDSVSHVVSILDPGWAEPDAFTAFAPHSRVTFRFHDVFEATPGAREPQPNDIELILAFGDGLVEEEVHHLLIHCHVGQSRSTAAAAILMAQRYPGREREAFAKLLQIRPRSLPNRLMMRMADDMLGCGGSLLAAMHTHYDRVARRFPELADFAVA